MELKAFFYFTEWAKATFLFLAHFSHCWCLSEAAPTIFLYSVVGQETQPRAVCFI
jgi:hypothetical protein